MNFETSEITLQVAQTARDFAIQNIRPHVMEWDESQEFPVDVFKKLGALGMMGVL
ncbi:MAG: acyl-CoA dehydrogenase family protein, partial [Flavisolibacter sp.]|nr:acyl-CoA dehydrogenase family protein [Flavisolibacter sp.]